MQVQAQCQEIFGRVCREAQVWYLQLIFSIVYAFSWDPRFYFNFPRWIFRETADAAAAGLASVATGEKKVCRVYVDGVIAQ